MNTSKEPLFHPIKLKNYTFKGNIFSAPVAGYSDQAYRQICIENNASFTFTEMVSCEAIAYGNIKTQQLMQRADNEKEFGIQLFTSKPEMAAKSIQTVLKYKPNIIDLNSGCPVPKITKNGAGSALMKDPKLLAEIIKALRTELDNNNSSIPVTVKIRLGWDWDSINYIDTAKYAIDAGAELVTIHTRTKTQAYSGNAYWEHLAKLKEAVSVPVLGSGDLFSAEDVQKMITDTKCDGAMIARGAFGNPFIFKQTKELLENSKLSTELSNEDKMRTAFYHFDLCVKYKGEKIACREMKKHLCAYTKGINGSANFRNKIVKAENYKEYKQYFEEFLNINL